MTDFMANIIAGSDIMKGVFLLVTGVLFVFIVQLIFYITIKLFMKFGKKTPAAQPGSSAGTGTSSGQ